MGGQQSIEGDQQIQVELRKFHQGIDRMDSAYANKRFGRYRIMLLSWPRAQVPRH